MKLLLLFALISILNLSVAQSVKSMGNIYPKEDFENIHVEKLDGDELTTQFLIWVKDTVRTHKHNQHSETVHILDGAGRFYLEDTVFSIKKGDFIFIPKDTWHSVKVSSEVPMKVISNQSPAFYGEDRVFKD